MIEFRVLGSLEVAADGAVVEVAAAKQRALLALLLLGRGRALARDELIDRLWTGAPPRSAVTTLQGYVAHLRRLLEPGVDARAASVLVSRAGGYALHVDSLDADCFEREHAAGRRDLASADVELAIRSLESALGRWRGRAFPELPDDAAAIAEASRLHELRLAAVEDLADARLRAGQLAVVTATLRHLLVEHPLRERARGLLALACYRDGRQAEALEVLSEGRRLLADELGLDPGPALQRLEQAILRQDDTLAATTASGLAPVGNSSLPIGGARHTLADGASAPATDAMPSPQRTGSAVPLVGRDAELRELLPVLQHGGVVVVSGEPGVGKTRLLGELAERARPDHVVLLGRCPDAEGVPPHWPWRQVLTGVRGDLGVVRAADGPFAVGLAIAERLRLAATELPLFVLLEDVHWADEASLRVLQVVAEELADTSTVVAVSLRPEAAERPALAATLAALARLPGIRRVDLHGLDEPDVAAYVAALTGRTPDPTRAAELRQRTAGNPFFLGELARLGDDATGVPPGVRDVIRLRVGRLPADAAALLSVGALLGRDVSLAVAASVAEVGATEVLDAVDVIVASGLATEPVPGRLRFTHALVREALVEDLSRVRRAALHGRLADALERSGADPAALAHHRVAAVVSGDDGRAAQACLVAARQALNELAVEQAVELAQTGRRLAPPDAIPLECDLRLVEGIALARLGDVDGAVAALDGAVSLLRDGDDPERFAQIALARAGGTVQGFWTTPAYAAPDLVALLEEAVAALGDDTAALKARVLTELVVHLQLVGRLPAAREAATLATQLAAQTEDREATIAALRAQLAAAPADAIDDQLDLIDTLIEVAQGRSDVVVGARMLAANLLLAVGRGVEADAVAADAEAAAREHRLPDLLLLCESWRVRRLLMQGAWAAAEGLAARMFEHPGGSGPMAAQLAADEQTSVQANLAWHQGRLPELLDALGERRRVSTHEWDWAVALALAESGRGEESRRIIASFAATVGDGADTLAGDHAAVLLGEAATLIGATEHADLLLARLAPHRGQLMVPRVGGGCLGAASHYMGGLRWILGDLDGAVDDLEDAVRLNDRADARPFAARSRQRLAAALVDRGRPGDAVRAAQLWRRARDDADALGMSLLRRWLDELAPRLAGVPEPSR